VYQHWVPSRLSTSTKSAAISASKYVSLVVSALRQPLDKQCFCNVVLPCRRAVASSGDSHRHCGADHQQARSHRHSLPAPHPLQHDLPHARCTPQVNSLLPKHATWQSTTCHNAHTKHRHKTATALWWQQHAASPAYSGLPFNQPVNQSVHHPVNQSVNHPVNQSSHSTIG